MFGTLGVHRCALDEARHRRYRQGYCGLCQTLGRRYGTAQRGLLSRDAVFVALVADGLAAEPATEARARCPLMPLRHLPTVDADAPSMRYAAAVQVLIGEQWLADRAADVGGASGARLGLRLLRPTVARARHELAALGIDDRPLRDFERRQQRVERHGRAGPRRAAAPTASALASVFGQLADLPGAASRSSGTPGPGVRARLRRLGRAVGRLIYLIDALEDLPRDHRRAAFNPCLVAAGRGGPRISPARIARTDALVRRDLAALRRIVAGLPWRRHRALVENVLLDQLDGRARRALAAAARWTRAEERARLTERRDGPWRLRAAAALLAVSLTLFGVARRAAAFAGAAFVAGGGGLREGIAAWIGRGRPRASEGGDSCRELCGACGDCCGSGEDCCDGCGDSCGGCCDSCSSCEGCCNSCDQGCAHGGGAA